MKCANVRVGGGRRDREREREGRREGGREREAGRQGGGREEGRCNIDERDDRLRTEGSR